MIPNISIHQPKIDSSVPGYEQPEGLIAEPQTVADILHNAATWKWWAFDWKDYATALEAQIDGIRIEMKWL